MEAQQSLDVMNHLKAAIDGLNKMQSNMSTSVALTSAITSLLWLQRDYDEMTIADFCADVPRGTHETD